MSNKTKNILVSISETLGKKEKSVQKEYLEAMKDITETTTNKEIRSKTSKFLLGKLMLKKGQDKSIPVADCNCILVSGKLTDNEYIKQVKKNVIPVIV